MIDTPKQKKLRRVWMVAVIIALGIFAAMDAQRASSPQTSDIPVTAPTQYHAQLALGGIDKTKPVRMAGTIKPGSVFAAGAKKTGFIIADANDEIHATYVGIWPQDVADNHPIMAQGSFNAIGELEVSEFLNATPDHPSETAR